jgi:hypothetical protein
MQSVAQPRWQREMEYSEMSRVTEWLKTRLSDGQVFSSTLFEEAEPNEISVVTLRRALSLLGCKKGKERGASGKWYWRLPGLPSPELPTSQPRFVSLQALASEVIQSYSS